MGGWLLGLGFAQAQFPGKAGTQGSTAIFKDSSIFIAWASQCEIKRGYQSLLDTSLGKAKSGNDSSALGKAGENGVLSLGDGGVASLRFEKTIYNGPGPDFAVFENAFDPSFLELAFVEVSSDGQHFVRFPAQSLTQDSLQLGPFALEGDPSKIHNLAGKYENFYGTPFDLEDLKDSALINVDSISVVRLVDVVGSIHPSKGSFDAFGRIINDPFPTPFPTSGFDLDAVGIIHGRNPISALLNFYPNPGRNELKIKLPDSEILSFTAYSSLGKKVEMGFTSQNGITYFDTWHLEAGLYFLHLKTPAGYFKSQWLKLPE